MSIVEVPTTDPHAAALAELEGAPVTVTLGGFTFTLKSPCPMGAFSVFSARLSDKNAVVASSGWPKLLKAWIVPEQHDDVDTMLESVVDMDAFATTELPKLVEAATARPT